MGTLLVVAASFVAMEPVTALVHRCVMHGVGRSLHRSHHVSRGRGWEANDVFPLAIAVLVMLGLAVGFNAPAFDVLVPVGIGVTFYGVAYALVHDVYTHGRVRLFGERRVAVLELLAQRHRRHHESGGAPYGMLVPLVARGSRPSHVPRDR